MTVAISPLAEQPRLVFFGGEIVCGVLERPDLLERFKIETVPTLVVVENKAVTARLERPRGCRDIEGFLAPWLN